MSQGKSALVIYWTSTYPLDHERLWLLLLREIPVWCKNRRKN